MEEAGNNDTDVFVYIGEGGPMVPDDVIRVRVHPSVTNIPGEAFRGCNKLEEVELCDGLLEIGQYAFTYCTALKRISIPSTVTNIHYHAFENCHELEEIELCQGLLEIGPYAFSKCKAKLLSIPSTVIVIDEYAFSECYELEELELCDGLQEIGQYAFFQCNALKRLTIPNTVRRIGSLAFCHGYQLRHLRLPESIESIGTYTFSHNICTACRIPPSLTRLSPSLITNHNSMFTLELSEDITIIEYHALQECYSLRNVAFPPNAKVRHDSLKWCFDLQQQYDTDEQTNNQLIHSLKHRFDNLPIHKMIYYQSYNNVTVEQLSDATNMRRRQRRSLRSKLDPSGRQQDFLGMTPLHIMACSSIQQINLYKVLVEKYPENLINEDRWGAVPLLYAVWGNAPDEIVQFLVDNYKSLYPNHEFNWEEMLVRCSGSNSQEVIQKLLDMQEESFPDQIVDWDEVFYEFDFSVTPHTTDEMFKFLLGRRFSKRISAIGVKHLRDETRTLICQPELSMPQGTSKRAWLDEVTSKLASCEAKYHRLKEATTVLELVLWKKKIYESASIEQEGESKKPRVDESAIREQCRVNCRADLVIGHVLPFLLPTETSILHDAP